MPAQASSAMSHWKAKMNIGHDLVNSAKGPGQSEPRNSKPAQAHGFMSAVRLEVVQPDQQDTPKGNGRPSLSSERGSEKLDFIEGDLASHERFMMLVSAQPG